MKKTLYDILEVSEKASKEVIEKAYKVLAKKYHPDLQTDENKSEAENKMKEINEAYNILSDDAAREKYDAELADYREKQNNLKKQQEIYENMNTVNQAKNNINSQNINNVHEMQKTLQENLRKQQQMYAKQKAEIERQYNNAYYKYLKSLGYKVKFKWTWKQYVMLFIIIAVLVIIGVILWYIPVTHEWMVDLYNNNILVNVVVNICIGIFNGIKRIFVSN